MISRYTFRKDKTQDRRYQSFQVYNQTDHEISFRLLRVINSDFENIFKITNQIDSRYSMESDIRSNEISIRTSKSNNLIFTTSIGYENENLTSRTQQQKIDRYMFSEDIIIFLKQRYRLNANISLKYNEVKNAIQTYIPHDKQQGINMTWQTGVNYRINRISTVNFDYSGYKHPKQDTYHQVKMEARAEF